MTQAASLRLEKVRLGLDGRTLLDLDCTVAPGEILTLMGPSGSGKSSLLAFVAGFLPPAFEAYGHVWLNGDEISALPAERRRVGLMFQDPLLFPHMSVEQNLLFAIPADVGPMARRREVAAAALAGVDLAAMGQRDPATLSGGQKARVALARVLLSSPRALLLDEPFSKLDTGLRQQMRELVFDKARTGGLPVLLVTHDEADASAAGGHVVRIDG